MQSEHFQFIDAESLFQWLARYTAAERRVMYLSHHGLDHLTIHTDVETLSDGSEVTNIRF